MNEEIDTSGFDSAPNSIEGATQVMQSWGIVGGLKYTDDGSLVLSDCLGQRVSRNDLSEFEETVRRGTSQNLTYQDVADYTAFVGQFYIMGIFPSSVGEILVIQRKDGATFGRRVSDSEEEWVFEPVKKTESGGYRVVK